jgi:hypothetical protein
MRCRNGELIDVGVVDASEKKGLLARDINDTTEDFLSSKYTTYTYVIVWGAVVVWEAAPGPAQLLDSVLLR